MDCIKRFGVVVVLGIGLLSGCSKSESGSTTTTSDGITIQENDPNSSPMAKAAHEFLDAVLKGDTQRASAKLTPTAMQRIVASGKQFAPPGLETASFKIGEVRAPSQDQAIVQCVLTDTSEGTPHSEEMCCLLRKIENDWRVCGIAYGTTPDKPWTLSDFETGQNMTIPRQIMSGSTGSQVAGGVQSNPNAQPGTGFQANSVAPPVTPPAPLGPPAGPANVNAPNAGTAGLGMPAVGPATYGQPQGGPQSLPPYTAQEPQGSERR
jgi:hypothetical protein